MDQETPLTHDGSSLLSLGFDHTCCRISSSHCDNQRPAGGNGRHGLKRVCPPQGHISRTQIYFHAVIPGRIDCSPPFYVSAIRGRKELHPQLDAPVQRC